ncbi:hypothetical protein HGP28_10730 [Vibrio sp. SM6]|uniref:Holin n=1 Tax=Vibrio agarilyticus TaxID=2726741 RepID=A0A7X8TRN2_9VIBR|nr:hypothetical protein [Vibrio agarilyticus]NLS13367.1 hypothetical protein [Vibrio agarilyticus]
MFTWLKRRLKEPSTKKGVALVGAGLALAVGQPQLITAAVTENGIEWGGLLGAIVPVVLGAWEVARVERGGGGYD